MINLTIDQAWEKIFEKYDVLNVIASKGLFDITAKQIKEYKEPRVMTKFDEIESLPELFINNNLTIISTARGKYSIGRFLLYRPLNYDNPDFHWPIERDNRFESLDCADIHTESQALLYAYNSNILKQAFETDELFLTLYGRMGTNIFNYSIDCADKEGNLGQSKKIEVKKTQIEIDAGFETDENLFLIEAKIRHVNEINLRQLYYPYKLWSEKISKKVIPVFFVYSDSSFYVYICEFEDNNRINSLKMKKMIKYTLRDEPITDADIIRIHENITPKISNVVFPQADSMGKIMDLLQQIYTNERMTRENIANYFRFAPRQSYYYGDAIIFLGLAENIRNIGYVLTYEGQSIMKETYRNKHIAIVKNILQDCVFFESFKYLRENGTMPSKKYVAELIRRYYPPKKEGTDTADRRAQTVLAWLNWIGSLTD